MPTAVQAINDGEVFRFLTKPWDPVQLRGVLAESVGRLGDSRRRSAAAALEARRAGLLAALEREHPGLTQVARGGGVYRIDGQRAKATLARLGAPRLASLWSE
jgi:hypothetical protein